MIQPSVEGPLNVQAYSLFMSSPRQFDAETQLTLRGGWFSDVYIPCALLPTLSAATAENSSRLMDMSPAVSRKSSTMQSPLTCSNFGTSMVGSTPNPCPVSSVAAHSSSTERVAAARGTVKRPFGAISTLGDEVLHKLLGDESDDMDADEVAVPDPERRAISGEDALVAIFPQHQELSRLSLRSSDESEMCGINHYEPVVSDQAAQRKRLRKF